MLSSQSHYAPLYAISFAFIFLRRNPTTSVVAVEDGFVVGAILCGHDGRRGCLYHVCVNPAYRRRGIGKAMVVFCMDALKKENINSLSTKS